MRYSHVVQADDYGKSRETVISDFAGHLKPVYASPQLGQSQQSSKAQLGSHPQLGNVKLYSKGHQMGGVDFTEILQAAGVGVLTEAVQQISPETQQQLVQQAEQKGVWEGWEWVKDHQKEIITYSVAGVVGLATLFYLIGAKPLKRFAR